MNAVKVLAKNTLFLLFSRFITSIVGFVLLIYITRYLGEVDFGKYSFAMSFTALFEIFADIGISQLIVRELSRNKDLISEYIINITALKLLFSIFMLFLVILVINILNYPEDTKYIVYVFGIYTILISFMNMFMAIFQAFEKMEYIAVADTIERVALLAITYFIFSRGYGLIELSYVYVAAGMIGATICVIIILVKFPKPKLRINGLICRKITYSSIPFGINILFGIIFFKIDSIMLSMIKGDAAVGIYSAAYNPLLSLTGLISGIIVTGVYPVMSRYFISSKENLKTLIIYFSKYTAIIGFPISVGCFILAKQFIHLFYVNQYSDSVIAFQILALFIPIRLVSSLTATVLTSINKQKLRMVCTFVSCLMNIALNIVLIPYLSYVGTSISTVLSEVFLNSVSVYFINKNYENLRLNYHFIKPFLASLVMGGFLICFKEMNIFLLIVLSGFIYFFVLIFIRTFTKEEINIFQQLIKRE